MEQTQQGEYRFFKMPIAQTKSTFPYLSAVAVFLSDRHKYWWLLKYPPKSMPPKCHLGYDTSCITWQDTQDCVNPLWNKFTTYEKKLCCVPSSWEPPVEKLSIEVQPSWETLTCSKEPLFPIYIFLLSLVKLKIKFEHLMEEVAWSYWLNFFMKIGVAGMK